MEWLRNKVSSLISEGFIKREDVAAIEASVLKEELEYSDQRKFMQWKDYNTSLDARPSKSQRVHLVNIRESNLHFVNPWKAMYLEKQGKLVRLGIWRHAECDIETPWTRARKERENSSNINQE